MYSRIGQIIVISTTRQNTIMVLHSSVAPNAIANPCSLGS